jgi:nucleoid-associated protein YgaU
LHRVQILTPEDHAQVEARKNQQAPPAPTEKSEQAVDAQSLPPDAPLGDVARYFRQQKQAQKLQQSADFHLPFAAAPVLASPKPPVLASPQPPLLSSPKPPVFVLPKPLAQPLQPPLPNYSKPLPRRIAPYRPLVKRSPFERPKFFTPEPRLLTPAHPVAEPKPVGPTRPALDPKLVTPPRPSVERMAITRSRPVAEPKVVTQPRLPVAPKLTAPSRPHVVPKARAKPPVISIAPVEPFISPGSSTQRIVITVKRGDSLWKLAKQNLGSGLRWRELLSANPGILDPNRIFAGSQLFLPPAISFRVTTRSSHPSHSHRLLAPT